MKRNNKTFTLALSGILLGINIIGLYLGSIIPNLVFTFYGLAGLTIGILIHESNLQSGILLYMATVVLAFALVPNKISLILYASIIGIYGFVKFFIEKVDRGFIQILLKIIFFAVAGYISVYLYKEIFFSSVNLTSYSNSILLVMAVAGGVAYDYIYTLVLYFYRNNIKRDKIDFKLTGDKNGNEER